LVWSGASAQPEPPPLRWSLAVSVAAAEGPEGAYSNGIHRVLLAGWGLSNGLELRYGPLVTVEGMEVHAFTNLRYTRTETENVHTPYDVTVPNPEYVYGVWERTGLFVGLRFTSTGRFSPYVEFGAGTVRTSFRLHEEALGLAGYSSATRGFLYDMGAGFLFRVNRRMSTYLFVQDLNGVSSEFSRGFGFALNF
jgi:hypothetical protein